MPGQKKIRIYLAGPMVFYPDPLSVFDEMKTICAKYGLEGVAPIDNQMGLEGLIPGRALNLKIVQADFDLMETLDGGIFCLDPWRRSPEMDNGTALEAGYMKALKKPMAGWTADSRPYPEKVSDYFTNVFGKPLTSTGANSTGATSGDLRDPDGMLVHSYEMVQHGMVQGAIELSGGTVYCDPDWKIAFEKAVQTLAQHFFPKTNPQLNAPAPGI